MKEPGTGRTFQMGGTDSMRGQSAPLAVILVFAIVISGSTLVVVVGGQALTDTRNQLDVERAQNTMTQLDSQAAMVAIGDSKTQQIPLDTESGNGFAVEPNSGWMNVSFKNMATYDVTTIYNESMGAVVYRNKDTAIAYQGGGVWQERNGRSVMVSPPELHYRDATLTLPMVRVSGDDSLSGRATITSNSTTRYYPNKSANSNFVNPLKHGKVNVTVGGPYYRAWGTYFEQRTDGQVYYEHARSRVTMTLNVPVGDRYVGDALQASSPSGTIIIKGSTDPTIDAYDSSNGIATSNEGAANGWNNGTLKTAGDVKIQDNGVRVYGNISAGGLVDVHDSNWDTFKGERVEYGTNLLPGSPPAGSGIETEQISEVVGASQIDGTINERVSKVKDDNENSGPITSGVAGSIESAGTLDNSGSDQYYVEHIELVTDSDTLQIDATDGNVTIAVRDYIELKEGDIEVIGNHPVRFYVKGESTPNTYDPGGSPPAYDAHLLIDSGSVTTDSTPHNSTQVWFYGKSDMGAAVVKNGGTNPEMTGVIYAPGDSSNFGLRKGQIYGGVVVNRAEIDQGSRVHFDKALENRRAVPEAKRITKVTYLHISVNRVNVTSG